jgi:ABC-type nitrate/sulfonate/bicarbonate transport system permease component
LPFSEGGRTHPGKVVDALIGTVGWRMMTQTVRVDREVGTVADSPAPAHRGKARRPLSERLRSSAPAALTIALIVFVWEIFNWVTGQPDYILPPLHQILYAAYDRALDKLLPNAWVTFQEIILGFSYGASIGFTLGTAIFHSRTLRQAILPLVISTQAIPTIAIAPIFIIWFGFGMAPKVIIAALIVFFPVTITTLAGLASVEREVISLMESLGASKWQVFSKVRFPASLPFVFAGLKNAAAISAIGAIVGEWVGAHEGLGPVIIAANAGFNTALTFAAIFYLATIAVSLFLAVTFIESWVIPWHYLKSERPA